MMPVEGLDDVGHELSLQEVSIKEGLLLDLPGIGKIGLCFNCADDVTKVSWAWCTHLWCVGHQYCVYFG